MQIRNGSPIYVDGVEKLHARFCEASKEAGRLSNLIFGTSEKYLDGIFVDTNEEHPLNKLKGYFAKGTTILRFLPITFDIALLFPVKNHGIMNTINELAGISYKKIKEWEDNKTLVKLYFKEYVDSSKSFFSVKAKAHREQSDMTDDIGLPVYTFPDISCIRIVDVPKKFLKRTYTLVGQQYYAPYTTTRELYCVLFAELDNEPKIRNYHSIHD